MITKESRLNNTVELSSTKRGEVVRIEQIIPMLYAKGSLRIIPPVWKLAEILKDKGTLRGLKK